MPGLVVWMVAGGVTGVLLAPWLAAVTVRLATRDSTVGPSPRRLAGTALAAAAALGAAPALAGVRPAAGALAWFGGAAVVLAGVDLASHRLPDRVTYPAVSVCTAALAADAAVLGSWPSLARAAAAAAIATAGAGLGWLVSPAGIGLGDVKLLGLIGLVLGWLGWGVLVAGVFLGLVAGSVVSLVLVAARRTRWRTALPFGPPLLLGAVLAVGISAVGSGP